MLQLTLFNNRKENQKNGINRAGNVGRACVNMIRLRSRMWLLHIRGVLSALDSTTRGLRTGIRIRRSVVCTLNSVLSLGMQ